MGPREDDDRRESDLDTVGRNYDGTVWGDDYKRESTWDDDWDDIGL